MIGRRVMLPVAAVAGVVALAIATTSRTHSVSTTHPSSGAQLMVGARPTSSRLAVRASESRQLLAMEAAGTEIMLSEHFDAFLEPRISGTPFPAWLAHRLLRTPGDVFPDPALAVYLAPLAGGWAGWILPGAAGVCVTAVNDRRHQARGECGTVASAERGQLVVRYPGPGGTTLLLGLAPDTAGSEGELRAGDQAKRLVAITNNAWTITAAARGSSIAVLDAVGVPDRLQSRYDRRHLIGTEIPREVERRCR